MLPCVPFIYRLECNKGLLLIKGTFIGSNRGFLMEKENLSTWKNKIQLKRIFFAGLLIE
jgi:hypothetical protein